MHQAPVRHLGVRQVPLRAWVMATWPTWQGVAFSIGDGLFGLRKRTVSMEAATHHRLPEDRVRAGTRASGS